MNQTNAKLIKRPSTANLFEYPSDRSSLSDDFKPSSHGWSDGSKPLTSQSGRLFCRLFCPEEKSPRNDVWNAEPDELISYGAGVHWRPPAVMETAESGPRTDIRSDTNGWRRVAVWSRLRNQRHAWTEPISRSTCFGISRFHLFSHVPLVFGPFWLSSPHSPSNIGEQLRFDLKQPSHIIQHQHHQRKHQHSTTTNSTVDTHTSVTPLFGCFSFFSLSPWSATNT